MLTLQLDGNLVLYKVENNVALWSTGTQGKHARELDMQADGNLVLYNYQIETLWDSQSSGRNANARLVVQDDGNLVVYGDAFTNAGGPNTPNVALWNSGTAGK